MARCRATSSSFSLADEAPGAGRPAALPAGGGANGGVPAAWVSLARATIARNVSTFDPDVAPVAGFGDAVACPPLCEAPRFGADD